MNEAVETIEYKGHKIEIFSDEDGISPRENDNMCIFHIAHRHHSFGDKNYSNGESILEAEKEAQKIGDITLPLYMFDHSGITISLAPFSCPWDSGQVGFVQVKRKDIIDNFGKKNFTKKLEQKAIEVAGWEVKEMDSYIRGEVYGYKIDEDKGDSCWGFICDIKYCIEEAKSVIDYIVMNETIPAE